MGKVALVAAGGDVRILAGLLPDEWEVDHIEDPSWDSTLDDFALVCFMPGTFWKRAGAGKELHERLRVRADQARVPVVVMADARRPETIVGLHDVEASEVFIQGVDRYPAKLARTLREIALRPVLGHVQDRIRTSGTLPARLRVGLRGLVGQVPPPVSDASEALSEGRSVFKRRAGDVVPLAGCSRSYLYDIAREAGVRPAKVVCRNTVIHGMILWESMGSLPNVATRLGYTGPWGWRMVVRRDLDMTVLEAVEKPLGHFAERLLTAMGLGDS